MSYNIKITKTTNSKFSSIDFNDLPFGKHFADHMFIADYKDGEWQDLRIEPFGHIPMHPSMSGIHYGQSIFEGMKAQRKEDGTPLLFRPYENAKRMNTSAERMAMPTIPEDLFVQAIEELMAIDAQFIPTQKDSSLYIRPVMFACDEWVGIRVAQNYKFMVFTSPVGAYYNEAVKVYVSDEYVRAFPGGTGFAKAAGNYAATYMPAAEVLKKGYRQILWLDGIEKKYLQEIGTMNVFVVIDDVLITPETGGTILAGITRSSVVQIAKDLGFSVEERAISIDEVLKAHADGKLTEAFGAGTAATVAPIKALGYQGNEYELPVYEESESKAGEIKRVLTAIKAGKTEDTHNWIHPVDVPVMS